MQATVVLRIGVGLVAGVDDGARAGGGAGDALPDVLGSLAEAVAGASGRLEHFARSCKNLTADEEWYQNAGVAFKVVAAFGEVVFVAAVAVACRVGVVLVEDDLAEYAFVQKRLLCGLAQVFQPLLAGFVVRHQLAHRYALGGGIFGVGTHIQIQARSVFQEDVAAAPPVDYLAEEIACYFVGAETAGAVLRAPDPVFGFQSEDPSFHGLRISSISSLEK